MGRENLAGTGQCPRISHWGGLRLAACVCFSRGPGRGAADASAPQGRKNKKRKQGRKKKTIQGSRVEGCGTGLTRGRGSVIKVGGEYKSIKV